MRPIQNPLQVNTSLQTTDTIILILSTSNGICDVLQEKFVLY
jgi:hypothetical protein